MDVFAEKDELEHIWKAANHSVGTMEAARTAGQAAAKIAARAAGNAADPEMAYGTVLTTIALQRLSTARETFLEMIKDHQMDRLPELLPQLAEGLEASAEVLRQAGAALFRTRRY